MENKVKDNREEQRIYEKHFGTNAELGYIRHGKEDTIKAMQEYSDLRCKELQEEVERLKEEYNKLYRRFMDSLPDSDY